MNQHSIDLTDTKHTTNLGTQTNASEQPIAAASSERGWAMEGCLPGHDTLSKISLRNITVNVGRDPEGELCLASPNVSKRHARFMVTGNQVTLEDLGSTNGTFVNGERLDAITTLQEGDLVQFADVELRLVKMQAPSIDQTAIETNPEHRWALSSMHQVLTQNKMTTFFQPIIRAEANELIGYEALVRATVQGLESPMVLFDQAARLGVEKRLSVACRVNALKTIDEASLPGTLFLNTHPNECLESELLDSIRSLREHSPERDIVLEIHEESVANLQQLREFTAALHDLDVKLAFDDFGAGQSRLVELCQASPDILKFDRSLIQSMVQSENNYRLIANLHDSARQFGILTLAEGVETDEEIAASQAIGFDLLQGYAFGKPQPIAALAQVV